MENKCAFIGSSGDKVTNKFMDVKIAIKSINHYGTSNMHLLDGDANTLPEGIDVGRAVIVNPQPRLLCKAGSIVKKPDIKAVDFKTLNNRFIARNIPINKIAVPEACVIPEGFTDSDFPPLTRADSFVGVCSRVQLVEDDRPLEKEPVLVAQHVSDCKVRIMPLTTAVVKEAQAEQAGGSKRMATNASRFVTEDTAAEAVSQYCCGWRRRYLYLRRVWIEVCLGAERQESTPNSITCASSVPAATRVLAVTQ